MSANKPMIAASITIVFYQQRTIVDAQATCDLRLAKAPFNYIRNLFRVAFSALFLLRGLSGED